MHSVAVVAAALLFAGAAAGSSPTPTTARGVVVGGSIESRGSPDVGEAPGIDGELIRFIPRGRFAIGLLLENKSHHRLVFVGARVVAPHRTLIHQIGTQFHRWHPIRCPRGAFCPASVFGLQPRVFQPRPFSLQRGRKFGLELDFRLGACADVPTASNTPISHFVLKFRRPGGPLVRKRLPLGPGELHLRLPKPGRCRS